MMMRWMIWGMIGLGASLGLFAAPPNFIVIYTDDHGWPDIGAQDIYPDLKTPHLDQMAREGIRFTNGYSSAPQCIPSRAGLLTGRFQGRFGVESNGQPLDGFNAEATMAERLKSAGYRTAQIGKWHLGPGSEIPQHGFDIVYNKNANRPCWGNVTVDGEPVDMQHRADPGYHLDLCSQVAVSFIRRHKEHPFLVYLAYRAPHVPLDAPARHLARFPGEMPERRRQALAMIAAMDDGVGAIRKTLKELGLAENTLLFFIGDNGAPLKIHKLDAPGGGPGWDGSLNKPMNGEKGMLAEGGIRVPFLCAWPGRVPGGRVVDDPVTALDVAPTLYGLAGLEGEALARLDGVNLLPLLEGKASGLAARSIMWRWIHQAAIREGQWKLLRGGSREYLFNLQDDPGELRNLASLHPERVAGMRARLRSWCDELKPPGLPEGEMSSTWETYFDVYFDGKTVAAPRAGKEDAAKSWNGWLLRNGTLQAVNAEQVRVTALEGKAPPFMTLNQQHWQGPLTLSFQYRHATGGPAGFQWRLGDQKDFVPGQQVSFSLPGSPAWKKHTVAIPAQGQVVHVRLLLPAEGAVDLRSLRVRPQ